jgi:tetratricopeptide (TPR) repeat protein
MKMRQVWTLLGEVRLALGQVRAADESGQKVLRIADELTDVRARGWGLYLRGWAAIRLGQLSEARRLLDAAVEATRQGEDHNFRVCAEGRAAFAALLAGDLDEALARSRAASAEAARRAFRHPSMAGDGIFLAAAALWRQRRGELTPDVARAARARRLLGREVASALRLSAPMYWAGRGAWAVADGRADRGRALIARAVALAEAGGLAGDLYDVHEIAARVLPATEAAPHAAAAAELLARFRG